jgi:outer membrane immunogenic protein
MRRFIIAGVVGCLALAVKAPVHAADMAVKAPPPPAAPAFSWAGGYVGGNIGAVWGREVIDPNFGIIFPPFNNLAANIFTPAQFGQSPSTTNRATSVIGGGQIGYNWQSGAYVYGLEGDFDGTGVRAKSSTTISRTTLSGTQTVTANYSANIDWIGTIRGKIGYAWDRAMIYGTGGVAVAGASLDTAYAETQPAPPPTPLSASSSKAVVGWTLGAGGEWAIGNAWSLGVEYRHIGFSIRDFSVGLPDATLAPFFPANGATLHISTDQVTARLNWHLGH